MSYCPCPTTVLPLPTRTRLMLPCIRPCFRLCLSIKVFKLRSSIVFLPLQELHNLQTEIESRTRVNADLDGDVERRNVAVNERRHVVDREEKEARRKREDAKVMRSIVERRRLVEMAKEKAQEVAVLRMEVERLRMRTFPALVQVEY